MSFFKAGHITLSSAADVADICQPLFDAFKLHTFRYSRVYRNGSRICLSNNRNWMVHFHDHQLYREAWFDCQPISEYESGKTIWDTREGADTNRVGYESRTFFNMHHGLTITRKMPDSSYCEFFNFSTHEENRQINHQYDSCEELFYHFVFYFMDKARPLIREANNSRIILPNTTKPLLPPTVGLDLEAMTRLLNTTKASRYWLDDIHYLTKKEISIISLLAKGLSAKEIARLLKASYRTVEAHIANAKQKACCKNTTDLVCLCLKAGIIQAFSLGKIH